MGMDDGIDTVRMDGGVDTVRMASKPESIVDMATIRMQADEGPVDSAVQAMPLAGATSVKDLVSPVARPPVAGPPLAEMDTLRLQAEDLPQAAAPAAAPSIVDMDTLRMQAEETPAPAPVPAPTAPVTAPTPAAPAAVAPAPGRPGGSAHRRRHARLRARRPTLRQLLAKATELGASDLHVHSGAPLKLRLNGELTDASELIDRDIARQLIYGVLTSEQQEVVEDRLQIDFSFAMDGVARFRANAYFQHRGMDGVFRIVSPEPPTLESLGMPASLKRFTEFHQGLVLFTGPAWLRQIVDHGGHGAGDQRGPARSHPDD